MMSEQKQEYKTVKSMIVDYLKSIGADGLVNSEDECGCYIDEICLCMSDCTMCCAAYSKQEDGINMFYPLNVKNIKEKQ